MAAAFFSKLPSIAYPPEQHGRWSPVTSTLDWCEEVSGLEMFVDTTIDFVLELCRYTVLGGNNQHTH
jgi:hypothetical protein